MKILWKRFAFVKNYAYLCTVNDKQKTIMKKELEIWRDVIGYEGQYQVSNEGRVRSLDRTVLTKNGQRFYKGKIFEGGFNLRGYRQATLQKNGKRETFYVHQLVAIYFLGHIPNGSQLVVDHVDGDKANNSVENLQIVTQRQNTSICHRNDRNSLSSKFVGVIYYKQTNKWQASIYFNSKRIHLGYYNNEEDASDAYQKALIELENGAFNQDDYKTSFTSKYKGVVFHKASQKWMANPTINGKRTYLGLFTIEEEAYQVILEYEAIQPIEK